MPQIEAKNSGILEVPAGQNVNDLPQSHFEKLVDKIGYEKVIRALTNLEVWNKDKNKALSTWASDMADKLKKKFRPESNEKEDKIKKAKKELDDLYYQMARAGAAGIKPPQSMFDRKNKLIKFLKANESIAKARIDIGKDDIDDAYMDVNYAISRDTNYTLKEFKKESMSTKQLLEAANRKCEMRWKVLAFNPAEDNKLVKEFKDFDCIDCAVAKKREYLEKNPTHIVEVISESKTQKNETKLTDKEKQLAKQLGIEVKKSLTYQEVHSPNFKPRKGNFISLNKLKDGTFEATISTDAGAWHNYGNKTYPDLKTAYDTVKRAYSYPVVVYESAQKNEEQVKLVVKQTHPSKVIDTKIFNSREDLLKYKQKYKKDYDAGKIAFNTYAVESSQKNEVEDFKSGEIACLDDGRKVEIISKSPGLAGHGNYNPAYVYKVKALYGSGHMFSIEDYKLAKCNESSQKNEALDEKSLKDYLAREHSRALKNIKNMAANDSSSFFKGYATALHEVQRKFGL